MKNLRRFFDHTRAHETGEEMRKPLMVSLTLSMVMIMLVAPPSLTLACLGLLIINLILFWSGYTVPLIMSYGLGAATLFGLRSTLPNGVNSPEFIACVFSMLALSQAMKLKKYWHCQIFLIWLLASNGSTALLDGSATLSVWTLLVMFLNLTQFLRLHVKDFSLSTLTNSLRSAIRTTVYTLPMLIVFIYVFHRSNENRHQFSDNTVSGISASLEPGRVSKLSMRSGTAYRVELNRRIPPLVENYWRVATLAKSKGMRWSRQAHEDEFAGEPLNVRDSCLIEQTVFSQQPSTATQFLALDRPIVGTFRRSVPMHVSSYVCGQPRAASLSKAERERNLLVDTEVSARVKKLVRDLKLGGYTAEQKGMAILRYFKKSGFKYTLRPGELGDATALDDFLFSTKEGFCEHYAAALATLLRLAKVPARVVVGFQGGLYNPYGKYWVISYQDAHAWVEFWNNDQWQRIDPVSVMAPAQLNGGAKTISIFAGAWLALDSVLFEVQRAFSGREKVLALGDLTLDPLLALGSLLVLFLVLQLKKLWRPVEAIANEQFRDVCTSLEAKGIRRGRAEGYEAYRKRVEIWLSKQGRARHLAAPLNELFDFYLQYRFGHQVYGHAEFSQLIAKSKHVRRAIKQVRKVS